MSDIFFQGLIQLFVVGGNSSLVTGLVAVRRISFLENVYVLYTGPQPGVRSPPKKIFRSPWKNVLHIV